MSKAQDHLNLLGCRAKDRVTGLEGVLTSICFDLYGCIQASLHPGLDKDGKSRDLAWYDVARIEVVGKETVMAVPDFVEGKIAEGLKGSAEKPAPKS